AHSIGAQKAKIQSPYKKRFIKSRQTYEVTIPAGASSITQALSPVVNPARAVVNFQGWRAAGASYDGSKDQVAAFFASSFTDGGNVTVQTNAVDASNARVGAFEVVEFYDWAVVDVQHFGIALSGVASSTYSLPRAVNTSYAHCLHNGQNTDA